MAYNPKHGSRGYRMFAELLKRGQMTSQQCAAFLGIETRQVRCTLRAAMDAGAVEIQGDNYGWPVYVAKQQTLAEPELMRRRVPASVWDYARMAA